MFKPTRSLPPRQPKSSAHVGDVRKGNTFTLLSESDSETEIPTSTSSTPPFSFPAEDPTPWGDQLSFEELHIPDNFVPIDSTHPKETTEADLWSQPWTADLESAFSDCYDTSALTDADYGAMMCWLYAQGWDIKIETRDLVQVYSDTLPPRQWVPDRFNRICNGPVVWRESHSHPIAEKPKKVKSACVPRFCRGSSGGVPCAEAGCRYVHADTMPRLNQPCGFGAGCGASDPTGVKRTQCLYMHPGETWDATMVITRIPAAPVSTGADP